MIGRRLAPQVLLVLLPPLYWLSWPLRALDRSPESEPDEPPEPAVVEAAKEEIRVAIEDGTIEGALGAEQKEMIEGILNFRDVDVGEIMTPRTDMECLEAALPLAEAVRSLSALRHSRIPVYEGSLDRITGIAYVKDLLTALIEAPDEERLLRDVVREPLFVPETKTVRALLAQFQREHIQIAIVLDEYGGVAGLLTVEDIMEEIVGEIQDEYDQEDLERRLVRLPTGGFEVDARMHIDEVNELLGLDIPEHEDYDTLGGFVTAAMARVPAPGEEIRTDGILVRVLEGDARRVRRVLIERPAPDDAGRP
jgi:putative hemolysin